MIVKFVVSSVVKTESLAMGPFEGSPRNATLEPREVHDIVLRSCRTELLPLEADIRIKTVSPTLAAEFRIGAFHHVELGIEAV